MADTRPNEPPGAATAPPFAFVWRAEPSRLDAAKGESVLVWPISGQQPAGAFARFLVIEDQHRARFVVPMDIGPDTAPARGAGATPHRPRRVRDDVGDLPLLLRLPVDGRFIITVNYLTLREAGGPPLVEHVTLPPVAFRDLHDGEISELAPLGFFRDHSAEGPAAPVMLTGVGYLAATATGSAPTEVDVADMVFRARETADARRRSGFSFTIAACMAPDGTVGRAKTIVPFRNARVRTFAEISKRAETEPGGSPRCVPTLRLAIGASEVNRALLAPEIFFFHWDRGRAALQSHEQAADSSPVEFYRGGTEQADLVHTFEDVEFGDVVGVLVGPPHRVVPFFPKQENDPLLDRGFANWTAASFVWTGDDLLPFEFFQDPDVQGVRSAVQSALFEAIERLPSADAARFSSDLASYLLPRLQTPLSPLTPLINAALAALDHVPGPADEGAAFDLPPDQDIIVLDPYCELLRELHRQCVSQPDADEWLQVSQLFSFLEFAQLPQLHRALVTQPALRRMAVQAFSGRWTTLNDADILTAVLRMIGLHEPDNAGKQNWLEQLAPLNAFAVWELLKREPTLVSAMIALAVAPDLSALSDHFRGQAAIRLQGYRDCTAAALADAADARRRLGHQDGEKILRDAAAHRGNMSVAKPVLAYQDLVAVLDMMAATAPVAADVLRMVETFWSVTWPWRPMLPDTDPGRNAPRDAVTPLFAWRETMARLPEQWSRMGVPAERVHKLAELLRSLDNPRLEILHARVAALLNVFTGYLPAAARFGAKVEQRLRLTPLLRENAILKYGAISADPLAGLEGLASTQRTVAIGQLREIAADCLREEPAGSPELERFLEECVEALEQDVGLAVRARIEAQCDARVRNVTKSLGASPTLRGERDKDELHTLSQAVNRLNDASRLPAQTFAQANARLAALDRSLSRVEALLPIDP